MFNKKKVPSSLLNTDDYSLTLLDDFLIQISNNNNKIIVKVPEFLPYALKLNYPVQIHFCIGEAQSDKVHKEVDGTRSHPNISLRSQQQPQKIWIPPNPEFINMSVVSK